MKGTTGWLHTLRVSGEAVITAFQKEERISGKLWKHEGRWGNLCVAKLLSLNWILKIKLYFTNLTPFKYIRSLACPPPTPYEDLVSDVLCFFYHSFLFLVLSALILCFSIHLPNLFFSLSIILTLTCSQLNSYPPNTPAPEVLLPRALHQFSSGHMGLLIHLAIHCPALFLNSAGITRFYSWYAECSGENPAF